MLLILSVLVYLRIVYLKNYKVLTSWSLSLHEHATRSTCRKGVKGTYFKANLGMDIMYVENINRRDGDCHGHKRIAVRAMAWYNRMMIVIRKGTEAIVNYYLEDQDLLLIFSTLLDFISSYPSLPVVILGLLSKQMEGYWFQTASFAKLCGYFFSFRFWTMDIFFNYV